MSEKKLSIIEAKTEKERLVNYLLNKHLTVSVNERFWPSDKTRQVTSIKSGYIARITAYVWESKKEVIPALLKVKSYLRRRGCSYWFFIRGG